MGRVSLSLSGDVLFAGGIVQRTFLDALIVLQYKIDYFLFFFSITTTLSAPLDGAVAINKKHTVSPQNISYLVGTTLRNFWIDPTGIF